MIQTQRFSSLVGKIYDCVAEPSRWPAVLGEITQEFEGIIATIAVLDISTRTSRFSTAYGDPKILQPLITQYAADMPFYHVIPKMPIDVPVTMAQVCAAHGPDGVDILHASRLWTEWFLPNNIADAMCTNIISARDRVAAFVLNVANDRRPIDDADMQRLSMLTPHIRRAVTIGDLFESHQLNSQVFRSAIDNLQTAVLIVSYDLTILHANAKATSLFELPQSSWSVTRNRLSLKDPRLNSALLETVRTGSTNEEGLGARGIGLPIAGSEPMIAHILPLAQRKYVFQEGAAAAIFVTMRGATPVVSGETIAALYGLTAGETRAALAVTSGQNRNEISRELGVALGTLKSQLESVFSKTGVSSQRELEILLREFDSPLI
jgi:DNA-binding CsgD family transcriptional regulator/PAS domain-containing protein